MRGGEGTEVETMTGGVKSAKKERLKNEKKERRKPERKKMEVKLYECSGGKRGRGTVHNIRGGDNVG